ncbi:MAG: head-tail connector protein [Candidatus Poribacteria bacterium]|nr:head-tail connector protein [Candidatus Poribacteria bacterium]
MAYSTLKDLKSYLRIRDDEDDEDLQKALDQAQTSIDVYCRTTFEAAEDSTRVFDGSNMTPYCDWPSKFICQLWFDSPLAALTSVSVDSETLEADEYRLLPRNDTPYYSLLFTTSCYNQDVSVEGRWAHSIEVPEDIFRAALRLAGYFFKQRGASTFDTIGTDGFSAQEELPREIPVDIRGTLSRKRFSPLL